MSKITIINQIVDTLKLHHYSVENTSSKEINDYNNFIDKLKDLKAEAMQIKSRNRDDRFVPITINKHTYKVMATATGSGFSVSIENGNLSISLRNITQIITSPIIKVEFRSEFLARVGHIRAIKLVDKMIKSILPTYKTKVSEIHLACDIQGYHFSILDFFKVQTRAKSKRGFAELDTKEFYFDSSETTGLSFGKGDLMLRIYDKTVEINKNKKKSFIIPTRWKSNKLYNPDAKVWRVEFQLRRKHFKGLSSETYGMLDSLSSVINSIPDLWGYCVNKFTHKDIKEDDIINRMKGYKTLKNGSIKIVTKEAIKKQFQKAPLSQLWNSIQTFNNFQSKNLTRIEEIKKPEVQYVENAFKGLISTFVKCNRGDFSAHQLSNILLTANQKNIDKKGISILDNARLKALDYLDTQKIQYINNGVITDGFDEYELELKSNIYNSIKFIDENLPTLEFYHEVQSRGLLKNAS